MFVIYLVQIFINIIYYFLNKMNIDRLDYDYKITNCIKYSFKTVREISDETKLDIDIVSRRIRQFRKDNIVFMQETMTKEVKRGIRPMKYKLKPIYDF